jgi:hypothetical protein
MHQNPDHNITRCSIILKIWSVSGYWVMVEDEEHHRVQQNDADTDGASPNNVDEEASESDRSHTVRRSGCQVKLRKDLHDSYVFTQNFSPSSQRPLVVLSHQQMMQCCNMLSLDIILSRGLRNSLLKLRKIQ